MIDDCHLVLGIQLFPMFCFGLKISEKPICESVDVKPMHYCEVMEAYALLGRGEA
jgi:hypothetical protein